MKKHPTSIQLDENMKERVDAIELSLTERAVGIKIGRSKTLKLIIEKGIEVLEAELNIK
jgi:predicted DNA-binding protein